MDALVLVVFVFGKALGVDRLGQRKCWVGAWLCDVRCEGELNLDL